MLFEQINVCIFITEPSVRVFKCEWESDDSQRVWYKRIFTTVSCMSFEYKRTYERLTSFFFINLFVRQFLCVQTFASSSLLPIVFHMRFPTHILLLLFFFTSYALCCAWLFVWMYLCIMFFAQQINCTANVYIKIHFFCWFVWFLHIFISCAIYERNGK